MSIFGVSPTFVTRAGLEVYADRYLPRRAVFDGDGFGKAANAGHAVIVSQAAVSCCEKACLTVDGMLARVFRLEARDA